MPKTTHPDHNKVPKGKIATINHYANLEPHNYPNLKPTTTLTPTLQLKEKSFIQQNHNKTHAQHNTP